MIVTLIPFLLAVRLESPDSVPWKHGTEVTYLIQNYATKLHSDDTNCNNMFFHLRTMLSCQTLNSTLYCNFHNTSVHSTLANTKQPRPLSKYKIEDIWTKKTLQQDTVEINYDTNGKGIVWVPAQVEPVGGDMITTLTRHLIIGVDLSTKLTGNFETSSNVTLKHCKTKFFITRSAAPENQKSSKMNLFLISQPDESLSRPLEISQKVEDAECMDKFNFYSFFATRELRKVNPKNVEIELKSAENFIIINNNNFTSYSKIKLSVNNLRENTKYVFDESISVSLQKISPMECQHCNVENSQSNEDLLTEQKNIFLQ